MEEVSYRLSAQKRTLSMVSRAGHEWDQGTLPYSCPRHSTVSVDFAAVFTAKCNPFTSISLKLTNNS